MKKSTIKNHEKLWQKIVEVLKTNCFSWDDIDALKRYIFLKLFPNTDGSSHYYCWLCKEKYSMDSNKKLTCDCFLLKYHDCYLYMKLDNMFELGEKSESIEIAEQIRDIYKIPQK